MWPVLHSYAGRPTLEDESRTHRQFHREFLSSAPRATELLPISRHCAVLTRHCIPSEGPFSRFLNQLPAILQFDGTEQLAQIHQRPLGGSARANWGPMQAITLDLYGHVLPTMQQSVANALEAALGGGEV